MSKIPEYQKQYSLHAPAVMDIEVRKLKADKMISVLYEAGVLKEKKHLAIDIGCSGGFFVDALAPHFLHVIGVDIDTHALFSAGKSVSKANITFVAADSMKLPLPGLSADLIICNHVYEHVPNAEILFSEIYRVLKSDGVCYFGAASRLKLVEPHYHLPFLSWLPKRLAHLYMRILKRGAYYYENLRSYWGIRKLVKNFHIDDYTLKVVSFPDKYKARDIVKKGGIIEKVPLFIWKFFYKFLPGYILILRK